MKIFYWSRFVGAAGAQARAMRAVDRVVVFSDKDAALLRPYRPRRVDVVLPPLSDRGMPSSPSEIGLVDTKSVLFTAAFDRPENLEAASWLLREVWPLVIAREPEATLTLAGVDPNGDARRLAADQTGVAATGYVNELGEFYRRSRVFVVPLRRGAGVKFKTVVAMLWGIPIVSTPIGVEGIGDDDLFVRVTDDADLFADGIVNAIVERDESAQTAGVALEWVLDRYSDRAFAAAIAPVYLDEASGDGR
ncbi:hypothetical protein ASE38_02125 [Cellulomonas sp. Root930]|nr:hypothetical protein ASE38_02125 [Cellulomonas sp. Root930]